jgi:hypothetical protein
MGFPTKSTGDGYGKGIHKSGNSPHDRELFGDQGFYEGTSDQIERLKKEAWDRAYAHQRTKAAPGITTTDSLAHGNDQPFRCPKCKAACTILIAGTSGPSDISGQRCVNCAGATDLAWAVVEEGDAPLSTKRPKAQRTFALNEG